MSGTIALGFRVKSGYAIGVALRGPATAPTAVSRHTVELSDPDLVETVGWTPTRFLEVQPTKNVPSSVQNDAGPFTWNLTGDDE